MARRQSSEFNLFDDESFATTSKRSISTRCGWKSTIWRSETTTRTIYSRPKRNQKQLRARRVAGCAD